MRRGCGSRSGPRSQVRRRCAGRAARAGPSGDQDAATGGAAAARDAGRGAGGPASGRRGRRTCPPLPCNSVVRSETGAGLNQAMNDSHHRARVLRDSARIRGLAGPEDSALTRIRARAALGPGHRVGAGRPAAFSVGLRGKGRCCVLSPPDWRPGSVCVVHKASLIPHLR